MTTTTPPAGMRFREHRDVVWTGEHFVFYGIGYKTAAEMIANFLTRFTDDDHAPLMALKANPLEPAPPEPVVRDATWTRVHELIDHVWGVATAYERNGRNPIAWEGTEAATDAILRVVRGARASGVAEDAEVIIGRLDEMVGYALADARGEKGAVRQHEKIWNEVCADIRRRAAPDHSGGVNKMEQPTVRTCLWQYSDATSHYDTSCGRAFTFFEGSPAENRITYCHGCGQLVRAVVTTHDTEGGARDAS